MAIFPLNHQQRQYREKIGPSTSFSINSATSATSVSLKPGRYRAISDVDCFLSQKGGTAATTGDCYLPAKLPIYFNVDTERNELGGGGAWGTGENDGSVSCIASSTSGTLWITKVSDLYQVT